MKLLRTLIAKAWNAAPPVRHKKLILLTKDEMENGVTLERRIEIAEEQARAHEQEARNGCDLSDLCAETFRNMAERFKKKLAGETSIC